MISLFEIPVQFPKGIRGHSMMGSIFHGALMERIDERAAAAYHDLKTPRPYSQALYWDSRTKQMIWRIGTLTEEAAASLLEPLQHIRELYLKNRGYAVVLGVPRMIRQTTYANLVQQIAAVKDVPNKVSFSFLTTASFKRDGVYAIFPEEGLVFSSLLRRWNSVSSSRHWTDADIPDLLSYYAAIDTYQLETKAFQLERHYVKGFTGKVTYALPGPEDIRRIQLVLASFAPFAGIGIKTALGMGAVSVSSRIF